jgi:DeoR family fructose operon transcriptional repressor
VADSSKIGREEFVSFAPIDSVDALITDPEISAADRAALTDRGVEVVLAGADS